MKVQSLFYKVIIAVTNNLVCKADGLKYYELIIVTLTASMDLNAVKLKTSFENSKLEYPLARLR